MNYFSKVSKVAFLCATLFYCSNIFASEWNYKLDPDHTTVDWKSNHFNFSSPSGKFSQIEGNLYFNEKKPTKSKVEAVITIANLTTGGKKFDEHLKSSDFFNAEKFPIATFKSTRIKMTGKNTAKIYGKLTLLGVEKIIRLDTRFNKVGINPVTKKKTAGFSATARIKRSEFGMKYGIPSISDDLKLQIEVEATVI